MTLISQLASIVGVEVEETVSASKRTVIFWSVIGGLAAVAATFLLIAAYLGLSAWLGPIIAALIIAGVALVGAAIVYAVAQAQARIAKREAERRRKSEATALAVTAAAHSLPTLLKSPLVRDVGIPVGAAVAAFLLANRLDGADD